MIISTQVRSILNSRLNENEACRFDSLVCQQDTIFKLTVKLLKLFRNLSNNNLSLITSFHNKNSVFSSLPSLKPTPSKSISFKFSPNVPVSISKYFAPDRLCSSTPSFYLPFVSSSQYIKASFSFNY